MQEGRERVILVQSLVPEGWRVGCRHGEGCVEVWRRGHPFAAREGGRVSRCEQVVYRASASNFYLLCDGDNNLLVGAEGWAWVGGDSGNSLKKEGRFEIAIVHNRRGLNRVMVSALAQSPAPSPPRWVPAALCHPRGAALPSSGRAFLICPPLAPPPQVPLPAASQAYHHLSAWCLPFPLPGKLPESSQSRFSPSGLSFPKCPLHRKASHALSGGPSSAPAHSEVTLFLTACITGGLLLCFLT